MKQQVLIGGIAVLMLWSSGWHPKVTVRTPQKSTDSVRVDSLLMRMSASARTYSYSGEQTLVTSHGDEPMTISWRVYHWAPNRTLFEFTAPKNLQGSSLVIDGETVKYGGDAHLGKVLHSGGPSMLLYDSQIFEQIESLQRNYEVNVSAHEPFLGREVNSVTVMPRYPKRPRIEVLMDLQTGLLLQTRWALFDSAANRARSSTFVAISYAQPDTSLFARAWAQTDSIAKRRPTQTYPDLATFLANHEGSILVPQRLPRGFALQRIRVIQYEHKSFLHFLYGDGLTFISFFQRSADSHRHSRERENDQKRGQRRMQMVRGVREGIAYNIMGEVAKDELEDIAASLVPVLRQNTRWTTFLPYGAVVLLLLIFVLGRRLWERKHG